MVGYLLLCFGLRVISTLTPKGFAIMFSSLTASLIPIAPFAFWPNSLGYPIAFSPVVSLAKYRICLTVESRKANILKHGRFHNVALESTCNKTHVLVLYPLRAVKNGRSKLAYIHLVFSLAALSYPVVPVRLFTCALVCSWAVPTSSLILQEPCQSQFPAISKTYDSQ